MDDDNVTDWITYSATMSNIDYSHVNSLVPDKEPVNLVPDKEPIKDVNYKVNLLNT